MVGPSEDELSPTFQSAGSHRLFRDYNLELSVCAWQSHSRFLLKPGYLPGECKLFGQTYRLLFLTQRDENGRGGQ